VNTDDPRLNQISELSDFKQVKSITAFKKRAEFYLAGMIAQRDEGGGRKLLGDNTGGGAVML